MTLSATRSPDTHGLVWRAADGTICSQTGSEDSIEQAEAHHDDADLVILWRGPALQTPDMAASARQAQALRRAA